MVSAESAPPANKPARRLYAHVVVPPERRKFRYRFDNDSLRKAAREYVAVHTHDYTEEGLREEWHENLEPFLVCCHTPWGVPPDPEKEFRKWARDQLAHARLEEFTSKEALLARYGPIEEWDVSKVTNMRELFRDAESFNDDLSKWDVSNVTDMGGMFLDARAFNGDLSKWDVSNVTDMGGMFSGAFAFNGDLSKWDVSKVTDMNAMFYYALAFNCDLSKWDVSKVRHMNGIFCEAKCFDCDLTKWNPKASCSHAFMHAKAFSGRLHPEMCNRLQTLTNAWFGFARSGRWLWRLVRHSIRPHVLARLAAYHLMELGARPDAEGNAPRGAIEAFHEDF